MAVYGQLLVDAGGGIIDHTKQSEKQEGATLIIGLGGTGTDAVMKIKREVYQQLKPDDTTSSIPSYDSIRFLVVDSDSSKLVAEQNGAIYDIDRNNEFFNVGNDSIKQTFAAKKVLEGRKELSWLDYENISIDDASNGAGGIRQVGRFLLVDKAAMLYAKIKSQMMSALTNAKSGTLNVHILSGLSGGTGSGTFLDICYLVRAALDEIGKPNSRVCGYFFLPDVNLSVPEISANPLLSSYIKVNGYAALQELDYCMNFGKNHDQFRMNYGFREVAYENKPVDLCYLVSTTDSDGNVIKNGYSYAMGVVADFVISFLAKVELPEGVTVDNNTGLTLEGHIANLNAMKDGISLQHGATVDYNVLGASVAVMPLSEIATYLGSKLFGAYEPIYHRTPFEQERDEFLMRSRLTYEDIRATLTQGCAPQVMFGNQFDANLYQSTGNKRFIDRADEFYNINKGILTKNATTMVEKLGDYDITAQGTSMVSRAFKNLYEYYVVNMNFGPFYAKRMLFGNNNPNLIHSVDGMIARNVEQLESEVRQEPLRRQDLQDAEARMNGAGALNKGKRIEEYKNALNMWYSHLYRVEVYKTLEEILQEFKRQLVALDHDFFNVLTVVLDTLKCTFEENAKVLSEGVRETNSYTWKILSIPDIQAGLDTVIKNLDVNQTLYNLMSAMFANVKNWMGEDQNEIVRLVSEFVLREFGAATKKTMTDYLKEKYGAENPTILADKIEDDIMQRNLWNKSVPLFWQNSMYKNPVGMLTSLTVPYDAAEIKTAAYKFKGSKSEIIVRESGITDKMNMMRFYSGLPMFAYQGIQELEKEYEKDNKPGRHLFEKGDVNWNELLPSPIPASFETTLPIERIAKKNERLLAEFDEAVKAGVVVKDEFGHWEILLTEQDPAELAKDFEALPKAAAAYQEFVGKLETVKASQAASAKKQRIATMKANAGAEDLVMKDFYLLSPVYNNMVKTELAKKVALDELIEKANGELAKLVGGQTAKRDFFNAIFSGVVTYGKKVSYKYDEFGMEKAFDLSNLDMPYGDTGAYCAFQTYSEMDEKLRERMIKDTKARMQDDDAADLVKETVLTLEETMPKKIQGILMNYEADLKHDEIEAFYTEFMKNLATFKQINL